MADASRFPHLTLPFALVGGAAGWIAAGIAAQPFLLQPFSSPDRICFRSTAALLAAGMGAFSGTLIRRFCIGKQYAFQLEAPNPNDRAPLDSWYYHAPVLLLSGIATAVLTAFFHTFLDPQMSAIVGLLLTLPVLPVCALVLSSARRAQRARMGSIVAGSDRRAVWGILAIALSFCALAAVFDWPAPRVLPFYGPEIVAGMLAVCILATALILLFDLRALRRIDAEIIEGLTVREGSQKDPVDRAIHHVDLGLGDIAFARVSQPASAYRGKERTVGLVSGDPEEAKSALRRALRRGAWGLCAGLAIMGAHLFASGQTMAIYYAEMRCTESHVASCRAVAEDSLVDGISGAHRAILQFEKACNRSDGPSCMALAHLYRGHGGIEPDPALVAFFEYKAAQRGLCPEGTRLVWGTEKVCVDPLDPRK